MADAGATAERARARRRCWSRRACATCSTTAEACVAAGKHVHLDKPAGESLPQFRKLLDAAAKKKLLVQMGYMYRYNPAVVLLREFLKRGLARRAVRGPRRHEQGRRPTPSARGWPSIRGGIMFELGCHVIDLVVGVLGKPTAVHAFPRHSRGRRQAARQHAGRASTIRGRRPRVKSQRAGGRGRRRGGTSSSAAPRGPSTSSRSTTPPPASTLDRAAASTRRAPGRRASRSTRATSPTPPTWPASSAARRRPISRTSTTPQSRRPVL